METAIIRLDVRIDSVHFESQRYIFDLIPVGTEKLRENEIQHTITVTFFDKEIRFRDPLETIKIQRQWREYTQSNDIFCLEYNPLSPKTVSFRHKNPPLGCKDVLLLCDINQKTCSLLSYMADVTLH